ncbi:flagellin N-terminal helical domain-containing protein [Magnetococcales bacterium HHB-1]
MAISSLNADFTSTLISSTNRSQNALNQGLAKIASGLKINSAADDAAGLSISNTMSSEVRGINQAIQNTNHGISMIQVADGGLGQVQDAQQRLRELAVQASNDTLNDSDRAAINKEAAQLQEHITQVSQTTEFNGQAVLASGDTYTFQVGPDSGDTTSVTMGDVNGTANNAVDLSTAAGARAAITQLDTDMAAVSDMRADLGAVENGLSSRANSLTISAESIAAARSQIQDTDVASQTANNVLHGIQQQAGIATQVQSNRVAPQILSLIRSSMPA